MTFKEFIISLFKDERGQISMKPLIAVILSIILGVVMIIATKKEIHVSDALIMGVVTVIGLALGTDTMDKFSFKKLLTSSASTPLGDPDAAKIEAASTGSADDNTK